MREPLRDGERRRDVLRLFGGATVFAHIRPLAAAATEDEIAAVVAAVAARLGARVGVRVRAEDGRTASLHGDDRFALTSTFKVLAAAAVLARVDRGIERLDRRVVFAAEDLVPWSPVTEGRVGPAGMSIEEVCAAAITRSDNTAGNLMLARIGGPEGLTAFLRSIGDATTRLDRGEPDLNTALPGDPRDTTTPDAIVATLERLIFGDVLSAASRNRLEGWMAGDRVGDALLRAGLPKTWAIADKTGAGGNGARAIVAVVRPPRRPALTIAIFLAETAAPTAERDAAIAEIGTAIGRVFGA